MDSGLDLRSYAATMRGGNLGDDVVRGKPDRSLIVQFVEGRRGPEHRMPLHRDPLSPREITIIRNWIAQGARK